MEKKRGRVESKVALVTGAASGLGAADAQRLADHRLRGHATHREAVGQRHLLDGVGG